MNRIIAKTVWWFQQETAYAEGWALRKSKIVATTGSKFDSDDEALEYVTDAHERDLQSLVYTAALVLATPR